MTGSSSGSHRNGKGELVCIATNGRRWHYVPVPEIHGDIVQLAVGSRHACARTRDGQVVCWGEFHRGQLGARPSQLLLTPTKLPLPRADESAPR